MPKEKDLSMSKKQDQRYTYPSLLEFGTELFMKAGLDRERAATTSRILAEADLMGHVTHGFKLVPGYLAELEKGTLRKKGEPKVLADHGSVVTWDGNYLPGIWLTQKAIDEAVARTKKHPVVTYVIRKSHHIACLAAYLPPLAEKGFFTILTSSDPSVKSVAPFGGTKALYTPNPMAMGIPAGKGSPIIIDISMSTVALGVVNRYRTMKKKLPGKWLLDSEGNATNDPEVVSREKGGTILPLGGADNGYKGFALGLFVEALTSGLAGYGRSKNPATWGASVFLQIMDTAAFGGTAAFRREMKWLADESRATPPRKGFDRVRVPGDRALELRARQIREGVSLDAGIMEGLVPWAEKLAVPLPRP